MVMGVVPGLVIQGARKGGRTLEKECFLPSKCLLESPFLEPLPRSFSEPFFPVKVTAEHLVRTLLSKVF